MNKMQILGIGSDEYEVMDSKARITPNIAEMKAIDNLEVGNIIRTAGYSTPNDGGEGTYVIRAKTETDVEDYGSIHFINDTLVAELIVTDSQVNVKQFGATGDGVTNDTDKIQKALNFTTNVFFPNGTYMINQPLIVSEAHHLVGSHRYKSTIKAMGTIDMLKNSGESYYLHIENLGFDGNETATTGLNLTDSKEGHFNNVLVRKCQVGVKLENAWSNGFSACDISYNTINMLLGSYSNDISIVDCKLDGAGEDSVIIDGTTASHNINIVNSVIQGCGKSGIINRNCSTLSLRGVYFENNNNDQYENGYDIDVDSTSVSLVDIQNCSFYMKNEQAGIFVKKAREVNIRNVYYGLNTGGLASTNTIKVSDTASFEFVNLSGYSVSDPSKLTINDVDSKITNHNNSITVYKTGHRISKAYPCFALNSLASGNPEFLFEVDGERKHRIYANRNQNTLNIESYNTETSQIEEVMAITQNNQISLRKVMNSQDIIKGHLASHLGGTTNRPQNPINGQQYFDETLGKPIWYYNKWIDSTGTEV